jgi:hypothetical protein
MAEPLMSNATTAADGTSIAGPPVSGSMRLLGITLSTTLTRSHRPRVSPWERWASLTVAANTVIVCLP